MSRQWVRKETNIGDIKKLREAVERMSPGSEIVFDEYLTDQHSNEYCNVNKFYYGAIVENADETYQAYTGYGRIGINTGVNTSRVGGLKLQKEGSASSNYGTAKYYLEQKMDKKKKGKRCSKCRNWASYTPTTPEKMAESMNTQEFAKLMGAYPLPPDNQYAVGGYMDEGFEYTVNQAEMREITDGMVAVLDDEGTTKGVVELSEEDDDVIMDISDSMMEPITEVVLDAESTTTSFLKIVGATAAVFGIFGLLNRKLEKNADTLIENPNTGDLKPADYEEIVVQSTGYYVPIIPVVLDGSFMGSRFHALPTDRIVYDDPNGIGAHIDVAMTRDTNFLPNEQSLVMNTEAPGQSPYNSMTGQENPDFAYRVIHETNPVSLDGSVAKFIPTDLSGYTGQQFIPTSVYEDMLGIGVSGQTPAFRTPKGDGLGGNRFGSRIANPDMLTNIGGPLTDSVNGDYTDGSSTMTLSQWSIENQVQQISDTEAVVISRGSGERKMIRRV